MHVETARWIGVAVGELDLPAGARVLDIGSSTLHYRTVEQPHIEADVMAPLRERKAAITHLDVKEAPGVDVVCDLDLADSTVTSSLGEFELVLFCNILAHVRNPDHALDLVAQLVAPGGWLIADHPARAPRVLDPRANMLRFSPEELGGLFERRGLMRVRAESVRIDDSRYYRGFWSRASWIPVLGRFWIPLPGFTERLRFHLPAARWRRSCVVMRRPLEAVATPVVAVTAG
jgi:SAM-dependent methyltransferase